jgi:hypothetical protein
VEIISRDRATIYAQGASEGAPDATQVADRFHLLQNMTDMLKRFLDHQPKILQETAKQAAQQAVANLSPEATPSEEPDTLVNVTPVGEPAEAAQAEAITPIASFLNLTPPAISLAESGQTAQVEPAQSDKPSSQREQHFAQVKALQQQGDQGNRILNRIEL